MTVQFPFVIVMPPIASVIVDASSGRYANAYVFSGLIIIASAAFYIPLLIR